MTRTRVLLAVPVVLLGFGGVTHLRAFGRAAAAASASNIEPFFGNALKALWLMDSAGMFVLAAVCVTMLIRPQTVPPVVMALLSLIPFSTAAVLYLFIGNFMPAHILIAAGAAMTGAALARVGSSSPQDL